MISYALPDEPSPSVVMPETKPSDIVFEEMTDENVVKSESEMKLPVHVMQDSWFARKRLKRVHAETLERVYRRTKRPTVSLVFSTFSLVKKLSALILHFLCYVKCGSNSLRIYMNC